MAVTDFRQQKYLLEEYFLGDFFSSNSLYGKTTLFLIESNLISLTVLKIIKSICFRNAIGWNSKRKAENDFLGVYLVIHSITGS